MRKIFLLILITTSMFNCKEVSKSAGEMDPVELKEDVLKNGNKNSYLILSIYYCDKKMDNDFLDISILMYEKYNYTNALSDIYNAYIYKYNPETHFNNGDKAELFKKKKKKEQEKALKYLEIGVKKGNYACIESLSEYYLSIGKSEESEKLLKIQTELIIEHRKKVNDSLTKIQDIKK